MGSASARCPRASPRLRFDIVARTWLALRGESSLFPPILAPSIGGQILVSDSTREQIRDLARIDGQLRVKVKGMLNPIQIYEVGAMFASEPKLLQAPMQSVN